MTKVQRRHAEAQATEVLASGPQRVDGALPRTTRRCGGCRFQDLAYDVAGRDEGAVGARLAAAARGPRRPAARADPARRLAVSATATRWSTRSRRAEDGPALGLHKAGRWDEVLPISECLLTTELGNAIRNRIAAWALEEKLPAYDQATHEGYLRHLVVREGPQHGAGARAARDRERRALRPRAADRGAGRVPAGAVDPLVGEHGGRRGDEPADRAPVRGGRDRGGDRRAALPRPPERVPADEHRDGDRALPHRAGVRRPRRRRDGLRPVLRDRDDRPRPGGRRR